MKLDVIFPELKKQREKMGAGPSDFEQFPELGERVETRTDLGQGVATKLDNVVPGPGGVLTYRGEQVLLYIKDTRSSRWVLENTPEESRRFHISECQTLRQMRYDGRFERYVVTNRRDGWFQVDWYDEGTGKRGETDAQLKVCKNCLRKLNWQEYADAPEWEWTAIWERFCIESFLREYSTFFVDLPSRRASWAQVNEYTPNWPRIARQAKERANWRCRQCQVNLSHERSLLHCHHRNGVVTDNSRANLRVLCALCHAEQPAHQRLEPSDEVRARIEAARHAQGLSAAQAAA